MSVRLCQSSPEIKRFSLPRSLPLRANLKTMMNYPDQSKLQKIHQLESAVKYLESLFSQLCALCESDR